MEVCPIAAGHHRADPHVVVVARAVSINRSIKALSHVVRFEYVGISYQNDLQSVGHNVSVFEPLKVAFIEHKLNNAFEDPRVKN